MQGRYASLKAAGMRVTLGLGLHFTPAWVKSQPNATFVDQDGGVSTEANMVFNNNVRQLAENYLARANSALPFADFWAIRVTSGGKSEVLYPQSGKYWAFDVNAQNGPAMPATMARNPFPGWRPGTAGLTTTQVTQWANWYVGALADTARWQANVVRGYGFRGYIQVVTPGIGVLNSKLPSLAATNLPNGTLGAGAAWGDPVLQDGRHPQRRRPRLLRCRRIEEQHRLHRGRPVHPPGFDAHHQLLRGGLGQPGRRRVRIRQVRREPRHARRDRPEARLLPRHLGPGNDGHRGVPGPVLRFPDVLLGP